MSKQHIVDELFLRDDFNSTLGMFIEIEEDKMVPHVYMGNFDGYPDEFVGEVIQLVQVLLDTAKEYGGDPEGELN